MPPSFFSLPFSLKPHSLFGLALSSWKVSAKPWQRNTSLPHTQTHTHTHRGTHANISTHRQTHVASRMGSQVSENTGSFKRGIRRKQPINLITILILFSWTNKSTQWDFSAFVHTKFFQKRERRKHSSDSIKRTLFLASSYLGWCPRILWWQVNQDKVGQGHLFFCLLPPKK